jgi:hypothetical protein
MGMIGHYLVYLATAMGITVLVVVQGGGPGAWVRERVLAPLATHGAAWAVLVSMLARGRFRSWRGLRRLSADRGLQFADELLGCSVCFSAWSGTAVGVAVALLTGELLPLATLWSVAPFGFWMAARMGK